MIWAKISKIGIQKKHRFVGKYCQYKFEHDELNVARTHAENVVLGVWG